jgi:hypothetical protein
VDATKLRDSQIYGKVKVDNTLTMGERIRKRFKPTETVKVHNITNREIEWQWLEESDERYTIEDGSNVKIVERDDPGVWRLGPGEFDILSGSCAYIMIEALYKQTSVLKTGIVLHPLDEREIKNFGFDDPQRQEEFIDMVFRGKVTPQMMQQAAIDHLGGDFKPRVVEELSALPTEKDEYEKRNPGRPVTAVLSNATQHTELSDLQDEFPGNESAAPNADTKPKAVEKKKTNAGSPVPAAQ